MPEEIIEEINPKTHVVVLEEKRKLQFTNAGPPPTEKFVVVNETLFVENYAGPIEVYSLRNLRKISSILLSHRSLEGLATDGSYLYLHLSGDFNLDNEDVLFVKKYEGDSPLEEMEFVGKSLRDTFGYIPSSTKASDKGIKSRVVSFPISSISTDTYVSNINALTKPNMRLVIPEDIPIIPGITLSSREGFAYVNFAPYGSGQGETFLERVSLKEGKFCKEELPKKEETPFDKLWIHGARDARGGLEASLEQWDVSKSHEGPDYVRIPIIFRPGTFNRMPYVLGVQKNGKTIYVLHQQETSNIFKAKGINSIENPALLIEYAISFKKLEDTEI